ncbi:TonB-dependent receptor [Chitinophagaceae bacterium IBVUCB2]|nr:TonB-dependent receptor [Chitinophagaceae bacterium IBVUCB2]
MKFRKFFYLLVLSFYITNLYSQQPEVEMENVIVTANQSSQQQKESGRNVITIKGETFRSLPVNSIDELLRYLPGIEVQMRGPQGAQSDIVIRGGTFQQVLVIIDGVKLNDPLTGHFNSYSPIHPSEIERIEILKGSASAIYGSEAVGGVINIITKTFADKKEKRKKQLTGRIVGGQYQLLNADAAFNYTKNNTTFSGGFASNNANGPELRGTDGFFHLTTANIAISQQLNKDWTINFRTAADFRKFNAQNFYTSFASDTANEKVNTWWNHLNLKKKTAKGSFNFDIAYKKLRDQYWFRPTSIPNDNKSNLFTSQLFYSGTINTQHSFTTGLQTHRKSIRSNDRGNHTLWHGALYGILRHKFGAGFYLNESVRLDWDESYGLVLVPQVNAAWSSSKFGIRASAGKSFRDADFTERYNNYGKSLVTGGSIGNPDLDTEQSWNVEAGIDYNAGNGFKIGSTIFYRDHNDLIDWTPTPYADMPRKENLSPTGSYALAKNVETVKTTGLEIDLMYNKKINDNADLFVTTGFTWLQSKNNSPTPSFYISSHAKYLLNFAAAYRFQAFSISVSGIYKERMTQKANPINAEITPSYFVFNTKAGWQLLKKGGKLIVQADNVFDKQYSDLLGSKMPGRWLSAGIEIALQP